MKKNWIYIILAVAVIAALVIIIFQPFSLKSGTPSISMPTPQGAESSAAPGSTLDVTPETVQAVLNTIEKASEYSHSYAVTTSAGSVSTDSELSCYKSGDKLRITQTANGSVKNTLLTDGKVYIWYDDSYEMFTAKADELTDADMDAAARLISYDALLSLPSEDIQDAKYVTENDVSCIYVKYPGDYGYIYELYISVKSGLLYTASVFNGEAPVFSMSTTNMSTTPPDEALFTPPST